MEQNYKEELERLEKWELQLWEQKAQLENGIEQVKKRYEEARDQQRINELVGQQIKGDKKRKIITIISIIAVIIFLLILFL